MVLCAVNYERVLRKRYLIKFNQFTTIYSRLRLPTSNWEREKRDKNPAHKTKAVTNRNKSADQIQKLHRKKKILKIVWLRKTEGTKKKSSFLPSNLTKTTNYTILHNTTTVKKLNPTRHPSTTISIIRRLPMKSKRKNTNNPR